MNRALAALADVWRPHILKEERHFSIPRLAELIEPAEHARLNGVFSEFEQAHGKPDYLVVPFVLHNLSDDDRATMSLLFPPIVSEQLVPVEWREKWAPMEPYLLP